MTLRSISPKRAAMAKLRHNSTFTRMTPAEYRAYLTKKSAKAQGEAKGEKSHQRAGKRPRTERQLWKDKADKYFSEFIRLRDSDEFGRAKCITCSHINHWRLLQNGHFVTRGHEATRFNEENCNCQCRGCNYNGGQHLKHADAIDRKHGPGTANQLEAKGRVKCKRTASDYRFLAETYKARVDRIKEMEPEKYFRK